MDSESKRKLTPSELQAVIQKAFGDEATIETFDELTDGWCNTGYRVTLAGNDSRIRQDIQEAQGGGTARQEMHDEQGGGTARQDMHDEQGGGTGGGSGRGKSGIVMPNRVVVKVAPSDGLPRMRCERNIMEAEVEILQLMREHTREVPVPGVYLYDASRSLVDTEYFVMDCMPGKSYDTIKGSMSDDERNHIERTLGRYNRIINQPVGKAFGYAGQVERQKETWRDAFLLMMEDVLIDGEDMHIELPMGYDEIRRRFEENAASFDEVLEPRLVHWDLWDGNVMVENKEISGILDFERAMWADPLMEFYFGHFTPPGAFTEGYGRLITTDSERTRRWFYDLYVDLILVIECTYRGYEDKNRVEWTLKNLDETWRRF